MDELVRRVCRYLGVEAAALRVVVEDRATGQVVVVLQDFRKVKIGAGELKRRRGGDKVRR